MAMQIHLLDVGETKYGDCLLVMRNNRTLLIDGAHPGDADLIQDQLAELLHQAPPFAVDLLVVSHCHSDHIGCLPKLVKEGILTAEWALVADEKLGFGRADDNDSPLDDSASDAQRGLLVAIQEEDHSDLSDDELQQFLADNATLEDNYKDMLSRLASSGTKLIRGILIATLTAARSSRRRSANVESLAAIESTPLVPTRIRNGRPAASALALSWH